MYSATCTSPAQNDLAIDDPFENSIFSSVSAGGPKTAVSVGGAQIVSLQDVAIALGHGSVALRQGTLQESAPISLLPDPVGATCSATGTCWVNGSKTLTVLSIFSNGLAVNGHLELDYVPAGVALDVSRHRRYIADRVGNAIHVYSTTTLGLLKTIT